MRGNRLFTKKQMTDFDLMLQTLSKPVKENATDEELLKLVLQVPSLAEYEHPERWVRVAKNTWKRYTMQTRVGVIMHLKYIEGKDWIEIADELKMSNKFYVFPLQKEFLIYSGVCAIIEGIDVELAEEERQGEDDGTQQTVQDNSK